MYKVLSIVLVLFVSFGSDAQGLNFPKDFQGDWVGDLNIYNSKGLKQTISMELIIEPIDSNKYTWSLIYGEDKVAGLRPYTLIELDKEMGHYEIDEDNSIFLDGYFLGQKFYQQFEVMGNLILLSLERRDENLLFEIIMAGFDPLRITGDQIIKSDTIPPVKSFKMRVSQVAILSLNDTK